MALEGYYQLEEKSSSPPKKPKGQQTDLESFWRLSHYYDPTHCQEVGFLPQCFKPLLLFPTFAVTDCTFNIFMNKSSLRRQEHETSGTSYCIQIYETNISPLDREYLIKSHLFKSTGTNYVTHKQNKDQNKIWELAFLSLLQPQALSSHKYVI